MASTPKTKKERIQEKSPPAIAQIPFRLLEKQSNKTTRLVASSGRVRSVGGQSRWFSYEFKEPLFIYRAVVNETGYPDYRAFEIKITDADGRIHENSTRPKDSKVYVEVNQFCKKIEFKPPKSWFTKTSIDSIDVFGFRKSEAGKFIQFARDVGSLVSSAISEIEAKEAGHANTIVRAQRAEAERVQAEKDLGSLKSSADRQKASIRRLESERSDLTTKVGVLEETLAKNTRERDGLARELENKTEQKEGLEADITKLSSDLAGLKANIDLFPSELDSFVKQGARNNRTFFWLAAAPIAVIVAMFLLLISGAVDLTTKITENQNINITALIVSRTPYVLVAVAIITACYQIARSFILEMIRVNRQRLNLTKVSIIAKDVSNASEHELNLSDEEKYSLRLRLKMEMLKDHLKGYVSDSFEIPLPTKITGYLPGGLAEIRGPSASEIRPTAASDNEENAEREA